ncbi:hypothetical protein, partial [Halomonas campaniensis]|uniref:hypothetical protein n=1 Tax=Halomonas campaniensis TaxID=213554 RepID=UPI00397056A7
PGEASAERRAPSAERRAPSAERRAPSAERRAPSAEQDDATAGAGANEKPAEVYLRRVFRLLPRHLPPVTDLLGARRW